MHLPSGIPTLANVNQLRQSDLFRTHLEFNQQFIEQHKTDMADYGGKWALDQLRLWSRRWEYPFVAQRLINFAEKRPQQPLKILDAGSGVTYFPYFIINQLPAAEFTCCDYDASYARQFERINHVRNESRVKFLQADLRNIPLESASVDALCCISVLEHTEEYARIVSEFSRVLKPGGMFVLTFDLSLDGKFVLSRPAAREMFKLMDQRFVVGDGTNLILELDRMDGAGILTTDSVRHSEPDLLPWSGPARAYKAVQDLLKGRGWTGGFRSLTVFCLDALNR
jgi:2-polyprenyl-3-methyl-5-hydroxy-6-metoxy-1,4-benzoquinol methylase